MNLKDKYFPILKHGFISLVDYMGSDQDVEKAARLSYNKFDEIRDIEDTRHLLRFLLRKKHTSPFEQAIFKFHVRLPIYVMRQWVRHRMASLNEISYRYTTPLDLYETIESNEWRLQSKDNKQGSCDFLVVDNDSVNCGCIFSEEQEYFIKEAKRQYNNRIKAGISREQARIDLPLSTYTEIVWTMDLHNLLHFLNLRCQPDAQYEIRQYANIIAGIVNEVCPIAFEAWRDYAFDSITFSYLELKLLKYYMPRMMWSNSLEEYARSIGLSDREIQEFRQKIELINFGDRRQDFILNIEPKPYSYFKEQKNEANN